MRIAIDTGGTFTDLIVEDDAGNIAIHKRPTTPDNPVDGILDVIGAAAEAREMSRREFLSRIDLMVHGTTTALNAILTGSTAKTALLTTQGHPDVLLFREGGRTRPFDHTNPYPEPYVRRSLTFEIPERIGSGGEVVKPLQEEAVIGIIENLRERQVKAVAVCLLWSIVNPAHEQRVAELLEELLPGVPYSLSHRLNPSIREYRRASSTAIDASLKPMMTEYLAMLRVRLEEGGFRGRLLIVTSAGGVLDASAVAEAPIHAIGSGPAMAPVAGRYYGQLETKSDYLLITDAGGTSYDVSLVRRGNIPWTRETWLGLPYFGHMTGFPSVDIKSIGAGGGSVAWVDEGGLLRVGPHSAGAVPGPVCYGRGGNQPTVTDASLVLGYIDPDYFLGGTMKLDRDAAAKALKEQVGNSLGISAHEAAAAVLKLATEHMVGAIEEITLNQGIDPRAAILIGGGGAAGLNAVAIARRLGCSQIVIPHVAAALSAAGALMSDLSTDFAATCFTDTAHFDFHVVNLTLEALNKKCEEFQSGPGADAIAQSVELYVEARYPHQIWELEVPLRVMRFSTPEDVRQMRDDFHSAHHEVFAVNDPTSEVELIRFRAHVNCRLREVGELRALHGRASQSKDAQQIEWREVFLPDYGPTRARVLSWHAMEPGSPIQGPAIIESPMTTVVVDVGASAKRTVNGNLLITSSDDGRVSTSPPSGSKAIA